MQGSMAIACNVASQSSHFSLIFLMSQFTFNETIGNRFGVMPRLKTFDAYAGKAILHRFGSQLPFLAIDLLFGRHLDRSHSLYASLIPFPLSTCEQPPSSCGVEKRTNE